MQALKDYLCKFTRIERGRIAVKCGTTLGHLTNIANGYKPCSPSLALALERESSGAVTRQDLRPNDYWLIWPDLPAPAEKAEVD